MSKIKYLIILLLLASVSSFAQKRSFSPWIVIKDKPLVSYVKPILGSGIGNHISLFVNPDRYDKKEWNKFIESCHRGGIETIYLSVGGKEKSFDTFEARQKTVSQWIEKAEKYSFDGIDMDLENLSPSVKKKHVEFLKYASEKLHNKGLKLGMAVGFYPAMIKTPLVWWYDPSAVGVFCDNVRIMLYDEYWAGNKNSMGANCSYTFAMQALDFWMKYVSSEKLTVNIPAYSNVYYLDPQYTDGVVDKYTKYGQSRYPFPPDIDKTYPVHKYWAWESRIYIYIYKSNIDGRLRKFYANDENSTKYLLDLFAQRGITSVGMWTYKGDKTPKEWLKLNEEVFDWCKNVK